MDCKMCLEQARSKTNKTLLKKNEVNKGTSSMVQELRLHIRTAEGWGSISGGEIKTPGTSSTIKKKKKKKNEDKMR